MQDGNGLTLIPSHCFRLLEVSEPDPDSKKKNIKLFVEDSGFEYVRGCAFYQFTKREKIQQNKLVVAMAEVTQEIYEGNWRMFLGLPEQGGEVGKPKGREDVTLNPREHPDYLFFVQSTSATRELIVGTKLLYKIADWN